MVIGPSGVQFREWSGEWFQIQFEVTSRITPWIVRRGVQLLIDRNYNKIREEYDSGINYLTGWYIQLLS